VLHLATRTVATRTLTRTDVPPELTELGYNPFDETLHWLISDSYQLDPASRYPTGQPAIEALDSETANGRLTGELLCWPGMHDFCVFMLSGPTVVVEGSAIGLSRSEVASMVRSLVLLQRDDGAVSRYVVETNNAQAELSVELQDRMLTRRWDTPVVGLGRRWPIPPRSDFRLWPSSLNQIVPSGEARPRPRGPVQISNQSDRYALIFEDTGLSDSPFTLRVGGGAPIRISLAVGVDCQPVSGDPSAVHCTVGPDEAALVFSAD
jgi:hypothetical protein